MHIRKLPVVTESLVRFDLGDGYIYYVHEPVGVYRGTPWQDSRIAIEIWRDDGLARTVRLSRKKQGTGENDMYRVALSALKDNHDSEQNAWRLLYCLGDAVCE